MRIDNQFVKQLRHPGTSPIYFSPPRTNESTLDSETGQNPWTKSKIVKVVSSGPGPDQVKEGQR